MIFTCVDVCVHDTCACVMSSVRPGEESHVSDAKAKAVCIALTQLSMDDENAYQIRKSHGYV